MKNIIILLIGVCLSISIDFDHSDSLKWGFYAHKKINRMAVFILPPEMMGFYKKNINFLEEHAPDPDKRRYAVKGEDIKHFMDVDHWGTYPFDTLPRKLEDAMIKFLEIRSISTGGDTNLIKAVIGDYKSTDPIIIKEDSISYLRFKQFVRYHYLPSFKNAPLNFPVDSINSWLGIDLNTNLYSGIICEEHFSKHGINPYQIKLQYDRLKKAFREQNSAMILRLSADMGHYMADAHVPLHATKNYNGQLTGQHGIHAFWESRLPELFADDDYEYFVGKARYIEDVSAFAWATITESNRLSKSVLLIEKELSQSTKKDQKYGFDIRLGKSIRIQTREYSEAYHDLLEGMVERRMQDAILALGSIWFTAWLDAGQPNLSNTPDLQWSKDDIKKMEVMDVHFSSGNPLGRDCK